jgi:alpha-galactosidase
MNRKQFIRISGAALGALVTTRWSSSFASGGVIDELAMPSKVEVVLDNGVFSLTGQGTYRYKDITVTLTHAAGGLDVDVYCPTAPLQFVRLEWAYPLQTTTGILGDHWERTYGDLQFQPLDPEHKLPWYFIAHDGRSATCMGVKTGCPVIASWQAGRDKLRLTMDTRNGGLGVMLGGRVLHAANIVVTRSRDGENVFATGRRFCHMLCEKPRLPKQPVYGVNDWYYAYGNNDPELILKLTGFMAELVTDTGNRPFSVIDAGWAKYSPLHPGDGGWMDDFSQPNEKFKEGMDKVADGVRKLGMRPGIWTRPLCAKHDDPISLLLPLTPGRDDPKYPILDPSIEENVERARHNIRLYRQWGYEMVKHDFTTYDILGKWGFQMKDDITSPGWHFSDRSRTTAEITLALYKAIREAAGDSVYLIGCNTFSHLGAGIFELSRVGDDTSGKEWERTRKMGVNTLGFRMIQHDNFYAADGDCVGLTKDVPWEKNKQWMELLAGSGTPLFISPQPEVLGMEQKQAIRESFARAARRQPPGEPLDWLTNLQPRQWRLDGEVRNFDWG